MCGERSVVNLFDILNPWFFKCNALFLLNRTFAPVLVSLTDFLSKIWERPTQANCFFFKITCRCRITGRWVFSRYVFAPKSCAMMSFWLKKTPITVLLWNFDESACFREPLISCWDLYVGSFHPSNKTIPSLFVMTIFWKMRNAQFELHGWLWTYRFQKFSFKELGTFEEIVSLRLLPHGLVVSKIDLIWVLLICQSFL